MATTIYPYETFYWSPGQQNPTVSGGSLSFTPHVTISLAEYERLKDTEDEAFNLRKRVEVLEAKVAAGRDALSEDEAGEDD